ncbi:hypothetical protein [Methanolacinia paynteri]|uniref:hypothetical protein n=1 Tax=Methanolacinia paynteri TaxID=230356 RepID=UPI00064E6D71|nr:hypothetical protein [Methanolacinia paynteri]
MDNKKKIIPAVIVVIILACLLLALEIGHNIAEQKYVIDHSPVDSPEKWIEIDPVTAGTEGITVVSGTTNLPPGTELGVEITTITLHTTTKSYDFSRELAEGNATVFAGTGGANNYSALINTSRLNNGKYAVVVSSMNYSPKIEEYVSTDIIVPREDYSGRGNYINWSALELPELVVNESIKPELPERGWLIVPPGTSTRSTEVEYGWIIDCGTDGICRIFDSSGVQLDAVYDSNEVHMMEVPSGAMVDTRSVGNVTLIKLGGEIILTKINEYPEGR